MRTIVTISAVALALASVSNAAAVWFGPGSVEPDTPFDAPDFNFETPDQSANPAVKKLYFNAHQISYLTGVNPNSGALGTHTTSPIVHIIAQFGIWKDCNKDFYIGHLESAMTEYPSALLSDTSVCPEGSAYNQGGYVTEFLHLGETGSNAAYNIINTTGIKIWGDLGVPGATPGYSCPLDPPSGTTASTGGMLRFGDCSSGDFVKRTVNAVDHDGSLGLRFEDPENPQTSSSKLNQHLPVHPWYDPVTGHDGIFTGGTENPAFTVFDCDATPTAEGDVKDESGTLPTAIHDETGELAVDDPETPEDESILVHLADDEGSYAHYFVPGANAQPKDLTGGSYNDALNQTEDAALHGCTGAPDGTLADLLDGWEGQLESEGQNAVGKNEVGSTLTFNDGAHETCPTVAGTNAACAEPSNVRTRSVSAFSTEIVEENNYATGLGSRTPLTLGVYAVGTSTAGFGPRWVSTTIITSEEFYVSPEKGPTSERFFTFYAYIPPTTVESLGYSLPAGGAIPHKYGADNCVDGIGTGKATTRGWSCDPDEWYTVATATGREPRAGLTGQEVRVGAPYQFRDVDCFNGLGLCGAGELNPFP